MAIKDFYPAIRPALDLNFAGSRVVDPRITFSRSGTGSIASYFDEKGVMNFAPTNIPRIDFDPATLECKGLLIEEQRRNLLTYSEQFDNPIWLKSNVTTAYNTTIAPNGLLSADKIIENTAASTVHSFYILSPVVSGTTYSFSIYAKKGERNHVLFSAGSSAFNANQTLFDINNGTVSSIVGATASISNAGNGWYRCVVSLQAISTTTTASFNLYLHNGSTHIYTGDGVSGIYVWGAQLEQGAFPTSYIPTTTAQVTRAADSASMSGANFSSWNNTTGTILAKYRNSGWQYNNTPPSTQLDLAKYIQDYSTAIVSDAIDRVMFYPRQLTEVQISALKG